MSEGLANGVASITDLKALRSRIIGKAKVGRPATNAESLIETLKGAEFNEQVKLVVPAGVEFDVGRFVQSVLRAMEEEEKLLACEPRSVLGGALRCAEIGLMVGGVMQHAFMVPRAKRDGRGGFLYEAELTVGYRGMIALAMRSGKVKSVTSRIVTDREIEEGRFDLYYEGEKDVMVHRPVLYGDRGEPVMVYCLVRFVDGTFHVEPMGKDEIDKIKESAIAKWNGSDGESPWVTSEMEMWRKSPVRRAFKYLNVQVEGLDRAIRLEEERERGQRQDLARLIDQQSGEENVVQEKSVKALETAAGQEDSEQDEPKSLPPLGSNTASIVAATVGTLRDGGSVESKAPSAAEVQDAAATKQEAQPAGEEGSQVNEKAAADALAAVPKRASVDRPAKYRDPQTGSTWNGWGKAPFWMPRDKGLRDQFLIVGAPAAADGSGASEKSQGDGRVTSEANSDSAGLDVTSESGEGKVVGVPAEAKAADVEGVTGPGGAREGRAAGESVEHRNSAEMGSHGAETVEAETSTAHEEIVAAAMEVEPILVLVETTKSNINPEGGSTNEGQLEAGAQDLEANMQVGFDEDSVSAGALLT
jgi:recombination protein RecT